MLIKTLRKQNRSVHALWVGAALTLLMLLLSLQSALADSSGIPIPGNLVVNRSFEQNPDPSGVLLIPLGSNPMPGWTQLTGCGTEFWGHGVVEGRIPQDGHWLLELDAFCNGKIQQSVPTEAGQQYVLRYYFSARPGTTLATNALIARVNGVQVNFVTAIHTAIHSDFSTWRQFNHVITATGSTTTISFEGAGNSEGLGSLLDNVSLVLVPNSGGDGVQDDDDDDDQDDDDDDEDDDQDDDDEDDDD